MVLKALLSRRPPEERQALERFLPESERLFLSDLPTFSEEVTVERFSNGGTLERVHWSWFLPTLKTYAPRDQRLFLSALDVHAAEQLSNALSQKGSFEEITQTARSYLREQLLHSLVGTHERILPSEFLPASPLNRLLELSKKELMRLIDFLALYDLCTEVRQIVETKILKKIYSFLTEEQRSALKQISTRKETYPFVRLGLERWDGMEESLRILLHKRGLARLAVALSGQDSDLIWTICHHLDIGRGGTLFKLCAKEPVPEISNAAIHQVEESLSFL